MLLEGRSWVDRLYTLFPEHSQANAGDGRRRHLQDGRRLRDRQHPDQPDRRHLRDDRAADHGRPVRGRARVARRDARPHAARRRDGRRRSSVSVVAFLHTVPAGIVVLIFVIVYQQLENHFLQPMIYGRTVQLSPLVVLVSVLVGAELAGVLGALAAIPVAGSIQVLVRGPAGPARRARSRRTAPSRQRRLSRPRDRVRSRSSDPSNGAAGPRTDAPSAADALSHGTSGDPRPAVPQRSSLPSRRLRCRSQAAPSTGPATHVGTLSHARVGVLQQLNLIRRRARPAAGTAEPAA